MEGSGVKQKLKEIREKFTGGEEGLRKNVDIFTINEVKQIQSQTVEMVLSEIEEILKPFASGQGIDPYSIALNSARKELLSRLNQIREQIK